MFLRNEDERRKVKPWGEEAWFYKKASGIESSLDGAPFHKLSRLNASALSIACLVVKRCGWLCGTAVRA